MIRVIHISDFHFDKSTQYDWEDYTKKSLIETINSQQPQCPMTDTFVICSGDMINKAGSDYSGVMNALQKFNEKVIQPVLEGTGLPLDHFILLPGNHEVDRKADEDTHAEGLRAMIEKRGAQKIIEYTKALLDGNYKDSKRIKEYNEFVAELYQGKENVKLSTLGSTFTFDTSEGKLGIAAFNTVWNCYDNEDMERGLAIGEPQYKFCKENLDGCDIKIAAIHHPLEWLKFEKGTIRNWFYADFQFLYVGHVHESDSYYKSTVFGSLLVNVAPAYTYDIRSNICGALANGFSIVDYTSASREFACYYYKYNVKERKYQLNNDICETGVFKDVLPNAAAGSLAEIQRHAIDYITSVKLVAFDNSIIPMKAHAINSLKEAFVKPPIRKHADEEEKDYEMSDLLASKSNILIFGTPESGKTVMLQRLLMEAVEDFAKYNAVPVYVNFDLIGNREIDSLVKAFLDLNYEQTRGLLEKGKIILFVDNYNPKFESRYIAHTIYRFVEQYNVKIIATADCQSENVLPLGVFNDYNELAFEYYFISRFSSDKVKQMMVKWSPKDEFQERNAKLEKMVSSFCNYSLPCTAMSVSLYLWSTEKAEREPVNESVLLDIYIEIILEKLNLNNAYQNSFDYKNKTMLLAFLAEKVKNKYPNNLSYGEYIDHISYYLLNVVGFDKFDPKRIGDYFIERKLFTRNKDEVYFAHTCFYHFFLAQRMKDNEDFKKEILSKSNYYKNDRAVSYYSGLVRNDKSLLEFLLEDVDQYFEPAQQIYENVNIDDCFTYLYVGEKTFKPIVRSGSTQKVLDNKPSKEEVEKKLIKRCDEKLSKISDEIRRHDHKTPDLLIAILANALRNLDGIEDLKLKAKAYDTIIRDGIIFTVVSKDALADYANKHEGKLPMAFSDVKDVPFFFRFMPVGFQQYLYNIMGTTKLSMIFREKFDRDMKSDCSDIERFMTAGILWDCISLGSFDEMKRLIKKVKNNVTKDYIFYKLVNHYNERVVSGSEEEKLYIKLFAALEAKDKFLSYVEQKRIEQKVRHKL
ncbi:MAG: metallophosphoesterase [Prevotella sp.]|nr:metallophosphoesterase [Prevotella sp.]